MKHLDGCPMGQAPGDLDSPCTCEVNGVHVRCVPCGRGFSLKECEDAVAAGKMGCPACGNTSVPMSPLCDVTVRINWHELRILVIWAERWASAHPDEKPPMRDTVYAIARRLQEQHPTEPPLTFAGELAQLQEAHPDMTVSGSIQPEASAMPPKLN